MKNTLVMIMILATLGVIANLMTRYQIEELQNTIAELKQSKVNVQVLNQDAILGLFSSENYDVQTQLEYLDILKLLLKKNNILLLQPDAVKFDNGIAELAVHPIDVLRQRLIELGIENPRVANAEEYKEREKLQIQLTEQLIGTFNPYN